MTTNNIFVNTVIPATSVIPAKAGIQTEDLNPVSLAPRLRGGDGKKNVAVLLAIVSFLLTASFIFADHVFADYLVIPIPLPENVDAFKVKNDQPVQKTEKIATIEHRPTSSAYVVRGRVQYHDVEETAYLEMWNVMPDGSRYFSRTLDERGTMRTIQGSSNWRDFELPFYLMEHKPESVTLEINIVMPGKGTIEVTGLTVSDLPPMPPLAIAAEDKATQPPRINIFDRDASIPLPNNVDVFKVENDQSAPKTERVATIEYNPSSSAYVVSGEVQYLDVEGTAYLEMWNVMPDGKRYFTRTLAEPHGLMVSDMEMQMRVISGTSDWRRFALPFYLMELKPESVTLEINIVMPGKGTIEVTGLTVSDYPTFAGGAWFDARTTNMLGGILLCCYGALFGILCSILVPRGKGKRLLYGMVLFAGIMEIFSLVIGLTAVLYGQPYHVWSPLVLLGVISIAVFCPLFFTIKKQYAQVELRKMQALDA